MAETRTLSNGAVYDMTTKRIVSGSGITTKITSANAREMQSLAIAKKRETVRAAANAAVQRGDLATQHGDMAYIAEIAQAQMQIATTPDAGKAAVMAATWLVDQSGLGERQAQQQQTTASSLLDSVDVDVLLIALRRRGDVVDAEAVDVGTDDGGDWG